MSTRPSPRDKDFLALLEQVSKKKTDEIEMHIIGAFPETGYGNARKVTNQMHVGTLTSIVEKINDLKVSKRPNIILKTFDVLDKFKPSAVAIDARNGKLIKGSELAKALTDAELIEDKFDKWDMRPDSDRDFNGVGLKRPRERH